jgi:Transferrin receptor-like dimerisation domain
LLVCGFLTSLVLAFSIVNTDIAVTGQRLERHGCSAEKCDADIRVFFYSKFSTSGSPSFTNMMHEITKEVTVELPGKPAKTVFEMWPGNASLEILGTGSDYTAFLQYAGIPAVHPEFYPSDPLPPGMKLLIFPPWLLEITLSNVIAGLEITGEPDYDAIYHSNYDCYEWYERFGDPGFLLHEALAKVFGTAALQLADGIILPLNYVPYANFIDDEVGVLKQVAKTVPSLANMDWLRLDAAAALMHEAASKADAEANIARVNSPSTDANVARRSANDGLMQAERAFLVPYNPQDVTGSTWYAHAITAPSQTNTYVGSAFPGVRSAIAKASSLPAEEAVEHVTFAAGRVGQIIEAAAEVLSGEFYSKPT